MAIVVVAAAAEGRVSAGKSGGIAVAVAVANIVVDVAAKIMMC